MIDPVRIDQVTIRQAVPRDVDWMVQAGREFHGLTCYGKVAEYDPEAVRAQLQRMIVMPADNVIFVAEGGNGLVGMLGAFITPTWFAPKCRVAIELFWWVDPAARKSQAGARLLDELERWWPQRGARGLLMLRTPNVEPKVMDRLYRIRGYVPWDGYYMKWGA